MQTQFLPVTSSVAGPINKVLTNVGVCLSVVAGTAPIRLAKLSYRVDLAPDQPVGTVNAPVRWRVMVMTGTLPPDVSQYQAQAFPLGAHPEIPSVTAALSANPILFDLWLDFSAGDAGLNEVASQDFADAGPRVVNGGTLNLIVVPIIDANLGQTLLGVCNAQVMISGFGLVDTNPSPSGDAYGTKSQSSLPRYDIGAP